MKLKKIIIISLLTINISYVFSQNLNSIQSKYCKKEYKKLHNKILFKKNDKFKFPTNFKSTKTFKMFNIPANIRLNLFPFKQYDSIFIAIPKHQEDVTDDYFSDEKNYLKKQLLTQEQKNYVSDILFNYYRDKSQGIFTIESVTCKNNLHAVYLILLFKKNNNLIYIALNEKGYSKDNFLREESFELDINEFKTNNLFKYFNFYLQ
ncbi:hypothetical protein [Flavobacterium columnare]|uniref:hypothetical protein n=1 Tax=Flavobacterium columnare TaxID=996 RepID=UPI0040345451